MHPDWLSNAYLVADEPGGEGVLIDSGAPPEALLATIERQRLTVRHLLLTHHHYDHVDANALYRERLGVDILAHPFEAEHLLGDVDRAIEPGEVLEVGGLRIDALHTPGHTAGSLAYRVGDGDVFTGDTLFKGTVGGLSQPGATTFDDLKASIMDVLMKLPAQTSLHPGHSEPSTVTAEWGQNAFIRVWRGLDPPGEEPCRVAGEDAVLVLWAPDYDGGHKAWVRWSETGRDDIVAGSRVERERGSTLPSRR